MPHTDPFATLPKTLADAPRPCARFCLEVERTLLGELGLRPEGARIGIACSGGLDSMALVLIMHLLASRLELTPVLLHMNHSIRPESRDDVRFVEDYARALGRDLRIEHADVPAMARVGRMGLEEAGRKARYDFFERVRNEWGLAWIATAHHGRDLAEDCLMRLMRGCGWPELGGMGAVDPQRRILRPLLLTPHGRITDFAHDMGLVWREDETNQDTAHTRNRVRHELLPLIERENPGFEKTVSRLWKLARLDEAYWATHADARAVLSERRGTVVADATLLRNVEAAARLRIYREAIRRIGAGQMLMDNGFSLDELFMARRTGSVVQFPGGVQAHVCAEGIVFRPAPSSPTVFDDDHNTPPAGI